MQFLLLIPIFFIFLYEFKTGLLEGYPFIIHIGIVSILWFVITIVSIVIKIPLLISLLFLGRGIIFFVCLVNAFIVKKVTN